MIVDPGPAVVRWTRCSSALGASEPRGAAAHPHPPRPRGRHRRALPPLPGPRRSTCTSAARRTWSTRRSCWRAPARLYGDDMWELWGEVAPVPEERMRRAEGRRDASRASAVAYTPGHASHHVCLPARGLRRRLRGRRGRRAHPAVRPHARAHAAAGHRRRGLGSTRSTRSRRGTPQSLCAHALRRRSTTSPSSSHRMRDALREHGRAAPRHDGEERFIARSRSGSPRRHRPGHDGGLEQAAPPDQLYLGLERYWRKNERG